MKAIKLDKKHLHLILNEEGTDLYFTYEGVKVAELSEKGKVKIINGIKLPYGYKSEMQKFIDGLLNGTITIKTN